MNKKSTRKKRVATKKGRPSKYTRQLSDQILELIAGSANGLDSICKRNSLLPNASTVRRWLAAHEDFRTRYTRAREEQADFIADQILEISDGIGRKKAITNEDIQVAKLRVDSRKWVAAKLKPKKYGDKIDATTDGESLNKGFFDFLKATSQHNGGGE